MAKQADDMDSTRWSLIGRLKDLDDQDSWRDFFELYWKLIFAFAKKCGLRSSEAEEVVQETIISVSKSISKFEADPAKGSFKNWLLRLTHWRITDQYRRRQVAMEQNLMRSKHRGPEEGSTTLEIQVADPNANVLESRWDKEWHNNLMQTALDRLKRQVSGRQFQIFYLHAIKNKPAQQVAKTLGINTNVVYVNKHRLSSMLKEEVARLESKMM